MDLKEKISEWVDVTYKPERLHRSENSRETIIANRVKDVELLGSSLISHHDSITGKVEWFFLDDLNGEDEHK